MARYYERAVERALAAVASLDDNLFDPYAADDALCAYEAARTMLAGGVR